MGMYGDMTRTEAIEWRIEVYGEPVGVATARVDRVYNPEPKAEKSWSEQYADMLDMTYC